MNPLQVTTATRPARSTAFRCLSGCCKILSAKPRAESEPREIRWHLDGITGLLTPLVSAAREFSESQQLAKA
jgi:hypothetical protein